VTSPHGNASSRSAHSEIGLNIVASQLVERSIFRSSIRELPFSTSKFTGIEPAWQTYMEPVANKGLVSTLSITISPNKMSDL